MNIKLDVALQSHVYHSSRDDDKNKTDTYYFYNSRSIIMLNKKHFGLAFAFIIDFLKFNIFCERIYEPKIIFYWVARFFFRFEIDSRAALTR